jgi:uncharacterized lipoprotein YehR (DUF1307 family)
LFSVKKLIVLFLSLSLSLSICKSSDKAIYYTVLSSNGRQSTIAIYYTVLSAAAAIHFNLLSIDTATARDDLRSHWVAA